MRTVVDIDDDDGVLLLVEAEKYAVVPTPRAAQSLELVTKRLAQPVWILGQRTRDELDDRVDDAARKPRQCTSRRGGDLDGVGSRPLASHRGGRPYAPRRSSSDVVVPAVYSLSASATAS